jgi:hypothetical protein
MTRADALPEISLRFYSSVASVLTMTNTGGRRVGAWRGGESFLRVHWVAVVSVGPANASGLATHRDSITGHLEPTRTASSLLRARWAAVPEAVPEAARQQQAAAAAAAAEAALEKVRHPQPRLIHDAPCPPFTSHGASLMMRDCPRATRASWTASCRTRCAGTRTRLASCGTTGEYLFHGQNRSSV